MTAAQRKKNRAAVARTRGYVNQAKLESVVRYSPEQSALRGLLSDAKAEFKTGVKADRGAAQGISRNANSALGGARGDYENAKAAVSRQDSAVKATLQGLGPQAAGVLAALTRESGGTSSRLNESEAATLGELHSRSSDAAAGLAAAIRARSGTYSRTADQVHRRQLALAQEKGAFTAATVGDLASADAKLAAEIHGQNKAAATARRGQDKVHGDKVAARKQAGHKDDYLRRHHLGPYKPAKPAAPKKPKPQSAASLKARGTIDDIQSLIVDGEKAGGSSTAIRAGLKNGNNPSGGKFSPVLINAAYDLHVHHVLSGPNIRALRRRGIRIPKAWLRKPARSPFAGTTARGSVGTH